HFDVVVVTLMEATPVDTLPMPLRASAVQWTPDSKAVSYQDEADSSLNVHVQPLGGGPPRTLTPFPDRRILDHRWSRDGTHLIVTRRLQNTVNLWATEVDGSHPVQLTDFPTGDVFGMNTPADGRVVVFAYGTEHADVVSIRGFR